MRGCGNARSWWGGGQQTTACVLDEFICVPLQLSSACLFSGCHTVGREGGLGCEGWSEWAGWGHRAWRGARVTMHMWRFRRSTTAKTSRPNSLPVRACLLCSLFDTVRYSICNQPPRKLALALAPATDASAAPGCISIGHRSDRDSARPLFGGSYLSGNLACLVVLNRDTFAPV